MNYIETGAEFSECGCYRYSLWRFWEKDKGYTAFVCLNPSTADKFVDDPTIRRCVGYAKDWGHGGMIMVNLFAYRSRNPTRLYIVDDPIGPDAESHIRNVSLKASITVAGWGVHGIYKDRDLEVMKILTDPHCLKITKHIHPAHPLYLRKDLKPIKYKGRDCYGTN